MAGTSPAVIVVRTLLAGSLFSVVVFATALARECVHVAVTAGPGGTPLKGIEDIVLDRATGVAYLSADDRRTDVRGGIYALALDAVAGLPARVAAKPLTDGFDADFHPHGIDLYTGPGGATLFAVNHRMRPTPAQTVEVFDVANGALVHRETLQNALIVAPNDLAADGPGAFYLTNDHGPEGALGRAWEDVSGRGRGDVVRYDGSRPPGRRFETVAIRIAYANGIALDRAARRLYVASSRAKAVLEYDLARGAVPRLRPDRVIPVGIAPDNLDLAPDGSLVIAGHPSLWRFALYALTGDWPIGLRTAPSAVLRRASGGVLVTLYRDDGSQLSASTVGVMAGNLLLVGSVFDAGIVACRL